MELREGKHDLVRRGLPEVDAVMADRFLGAADEASIVRVAPVPPSHGRRRG